MVKLPSVSGKKAIKVFKKIGYQIIRKRGSHFRLHCQNKEPLTIPDHKNLVKGLLRKILRDSEITTKEFIKLLKK
ncbi:MAG: type II toxin-antitoxin system HicA family toxin [Patescibacteria group bacterium]|nr:type II toxin-antitoxin system HicA family toxin [Patescibacteria group bacterium]